MDDDANSEDREPHEATTLFLTYLTKNIPDLPQTTPYSLTGTAARARIEAMAPETHATWQDVLHARLRAVIASNAKVLTTAVIAGLPLLDFDRRKIAAEACLYETVASLLRIEGDDLVRARVTSIQKRGVRFQKTCEKCGERFEAKVRKVRYCSERCSKTANREKNAERYLAKKEAVFAKAV